MWAKGEKKRENGKTTKVATDWITGHWSAEFVYILITKALTGESWTLIGATICHCDINTSILIYNAWIYLSHHSTAQADQQA